MNLRSQWARGQTKEYNEPIDGRLHPSNIFDFAEKSWTEKRELLPHLALFFHEPRVKFAKGIKGEAGTSSVVASKRGRKKNELAVAIPVAELVSARPDDLPVAVLPALPMPPKKILSFPLTGGVVAPISKIPDGPSLSDFFGSKSIERENPQRKRKAVGKLAEVTVASQNDKGKGREVDRTPAPTSKSGKGKAIDLPDDVAAGEANRFVPVFPCHDAYVKADDSAIDDKEMSLALMENIILFEDAKKIRPQPLEDDSREFANCAYKLEHARKKDELLQKANTEVTSLRAQNKDLKVKLDSTKKENVQLNKDIDEAHHTFLKLESQLASVTSSWESDATKSVEVISQWCKIAYAWEERCVHCESHLASLVEGFDPSVDQEAIKISALERYDRDVNGVEGQTSSGGAIAEGDADVADGVEVGTQSENPGEDGDIVMDEQRPQQ